MNPDANECYTDFAIQEYIAGRLDPGVRVDLERHLQGCAECSLAKNAFDAESRLLRGAFRSSNSPASNAKVSTETLALYLCGALDSVEATKLEAMLSADPVLTGRLVALARETDAVREGALPGAVVAPKAPEGVVIRMPRRTARPATIILPESQAGGLGA